MPQKKHELNRFDQLFLVQCASVCTSIKFLPSILNWLIANFKQVEKLLNNWYVPQKTAPKVQYTPLTIMLYLLQTVNSEQCVLMIILSLKMALFRLPLQQYTIMINPKPLCIKLNQAAFCLKSKHKLWCLIVLFS